MAWRPVVALLLVAPYLGEVLSTATSPLALPLPWNLAMFSALYGSGALICREVAFRWGLGLPGLIVLGMAYGVFEEALVDRFWFDPEYARTTGVGSYAEVGHTNLVLATHLTAFHSAVSVCSSVLIVTWLFPQYRDRAWVRPPWLFVAGLAMVAVLFITSEDYYRPPVGPILVAIGIGILFVVAAFFVRREPREHTGRPRPRLLGLVAFLCAGVHFVLVYAIPSTGLPWPLGLAITLAPLAIGVLLARRWVTEPHGPDGLWIVTGIIGFFILLDAYVGLSGRYDLAIGAVITTVGVILLHRRTKAGLRSRSRT